MLKSILIQPFCTTHDVRIQYDIINISNPKDKERFYSVVGYICETDTFANNKRISTISEGDVLCFKMPELTVLQWLVIITPDINPLRYYF